MPSSLPGYRQPTLTSIIGIDPGLTSGCAHVVYDSERRAATVASSAELPVRETGDWLSEQLVDSNERQCFVVMERFVITRETARNSQAPWSLIVIGQSQWIVWTMRPDIGSVVLQSPSDAKAAMSNTRLRALGLWHRGGRGHAVDALRHAGLFMMKRKMFLATT